MKTKKGQISACHSRAGGNPATVKGQGAGKKPNGFTLIESLFAAMLIGLVIAAICVSSGAATMANGAGIDLSTAEFLTEEIRERTASMAFDQVVALNGVTYSTPIDISGAAMTEFGAFAQQITVLKVSASDLTSPDTSSDFAKVTVTITKNGSSVSSASWIRARLN